MPGLLRIFLTLTGRHAGLLGAHTRARAGHLLMLGAFGTAAAVFGAALGFVALERWIGLLPALGVMAGVSVAGVGFVFLLMQAEQRQHEAAMLRQTETERRMAQAALLTALPTLKRGGLLAAGLGLAALTLLARRGGGDRS